MASYKPVQPGGGDDDDDDERCPDSPDLDVGHAQAVCPTPERHAPLGNTHDTVLEEMTGQGCVYVCKREFSRHVSFETRWVVVSDRSLDQVGQICPCQPIRSWEGRGLARGLRARERVRVRACVCGEKCMLYAVR
jgi:hypothetical protein